ncbi:PIG-L deacetylase family protein [Vibrio coralliilyticus]|uniref:PIG-L deacetylase family protein n=1 Tax=Vibrio coralliilyticus TaxID=190893 RepID=UPI00155FF1E0|nr:PIG-L deacetylase family protein [Vibrio coralliilyticus]NRF32506.1 PIG-L family deacetylase [Vibrio coralliilyticus]NRF54535.1 PIG-L family deacetylase [Vibrio coralliilyticus]NRG05858.1 PIG-L family deacetylase [Vibrio coralliilyticus]
MKTALIVAPHADDETLGCGGTILKLVEQGYQVHWLLVTGMTEGTGFSKAQIRTRKSEIEKVAMAYGFAATYELGLPPASLETLPKGDIIAPISAIVGKVKPSLVFTVYRNDAHSDHEIVFDAVMSATKSFRYPFVKKVMAYETMSETDFGMKPEDGGFRPTVYFDITDHLSRKLEILEIFESEVHDFPFPRSRIALEALARVRGVQCNSEAAEAFMLIKEIL